MTDHKTQNDSSRSDFQGVCAALATPPGQSGLAVIRLSGPGSPQAADCLFKPASQRFGSVSSMDGYTCAVGDLIDPGDGRLLDQVVVTRFAAPHSFTGEDVVEFSCHGGVAIKQAILSSLFSLGVRPAEPGEFTKRAFINGKMDLTQAEAVMDLIQSEARKSAQTAAIQLRGALSARIREFSQDVYRSLAQIELILEYPEHEESDEALTTLANDLEALQDKVVELNDSFRQGRILREGLIVVIAGRPNAGKSSLLNALSGYDRAIVTPLPGTTRDTIEELVDIDGVPVRLVDTAGLRVTDDLIEKIGVNRARSALQSADLVFWLASPPQSELAGELAEIREFIKTGLPVVAIAGKDDLAESQNIRKFLEDNLTGCPVISFSAISGEGLAALRQVILEHYERSGSLSGQDVLITNGRHRAGLELAMEHLREANQTIRSGIPLDLTSSLLRGCAAALAAITGDEVTEELINTIFSRFCVGK